MKVLCFFRENNKPLIRALKVALIVGALLNFINNPSLWHLSFADINIWRVILTFFVPFGVSLYSSLMTSQNLSVNRLKN
jgi:hypothetical protein